MTLDMTCCSDMMRVGEIGTALRLSRARIYSLIKVGELPSTKVGGAIRIPRLAYEKWLETRTNEALGYKGTKA